MKLCMDCFVALTLLLGTIADAQQPLPPSSWYLTSPVEGRPSDDDAAARDAVLQQIEKLQSDQFRRTFQLDVPNHATGLPPHYNILVYGTYSSDAAWIKVEVRGDKATAEYASNGRHAFRRGPLPVKEVNQRTREFLYGSRTTASFRNVKHDRASAKIQGTRFATHTIFFRIELESQDPDHPLRLMTDARQPLEDTISNFDNGMKAFSHSRYCKSLMELVVTHLPIGSSQGIEADEIVQRLNAWASRGDQIGGAWATARANDIPGIEVVPNMKLDSDGFEKAIVEAHVLGKVAIDTRVSEAASILDQLGLKELADHVRLVTDKDSVTALRSGLLSSHWATYQVALTTTGDRLNADDVKLLLEVTPSLLDSFRVSHVLKKLESAELDANQISTVRELYLNGRDQRARVAAARLLVWKTDDEEIYRELVSIALQPIKFDGSDLYSPALYARTALANYSLRTGRRRAATADMMRTLLDRIPADAHQNYNGKSQLAQVLGQLGDTSDLSRLESLIGTRDLDLNVSAIHAIADLGGSQASELAREQIKRYLDNQAQTSYRWSVYPYLDLIFWKRDHASTELLIKALEKEGKSPVFAESGQHEIKALIAYLQSERAEDRAAAAVRFANYYLTSRSPWIIDVGKQLVAEGADPKLCEPLLESGLQKQF